MNIRHQVGTLRIFVITFHEQLARFVVQTAFREWHNQKATNNTQDMSKSSGCRPVLLQSVHTNCTSGHVDVGMINFCQEETPGRRLRKINAEYKFQPKEFGLVRSPLWSFELSLAEKNSKAKCENQGDINTNEKKVCKRFLVSRLQPRELVEEIFSAPPAVRLGYLACNLPQSLPNS